MVHTDTESSTVARSSRDPRIFLLTHSHSVMVMPASFSRATRVTLQRSCTCTRSTLTRAREPSDAPQIRGASSNLMRNYGSPSATLEGQCLDEQTHLLLHLKHNLSFFSSSESGVPVGLWSWDLNTDCCRSWEGVECNQIGEVIRLDLSNKSIAGSTDGLASLFHLTHLQGLNLGYNYFNFAIPSGFDRLPHLTHLNLSNSYFVGQIPIGISRLNDVAVTKEMV
ncbi:hypothetical protein Sjap_026127 [Stephania japonica]|uniref:Leucine-rich repeat-containing N-terminal plant-type domain-containing protein n=1 Tax=Stephania japonica TaxID=461633 RepID=A0AAP0E320_9MAGN